MEHLKLRIIEIRQETRESKSYFVEEISGRKINYKAGQFITIIVELQGKEIRRSYSICSTPAVDDQLFFTIKRIENGELSRYLLDVLQPGDTIDCLPPTGRFTIDDTEAELSVFIAAGSGITPVFSLVKHLLHSFLSAKVLLIYQNRNEEEAIFRQHFLLLQQQHADQFTFKEILSQPLNEGTPSQRLNNNLLERILINSIKAQSVKFYLCGPAPFMRMAEFTLKVMKYNEGSIRKENFFATPPPPPFIADQKSHNVFIHYAGKSYNITVAYPQTILDAALKNDIKLPYSCKGGRCSTCTARCTTGKVKMSINDVLTPNDLNNGLILTCVSYPESDVEIVFETLEHGIVAK